jgi:hypothetical protein
MKPSESGPVERGSCRHTCVIGAKIAAKNATVVVTMTACLVLLMDLTSLRLTYCRR